jgi:HK97 gp10 family phage protein
MAKILGLAKLNRKLSLLPHAVKAEIKTAMEAAANDMVATMKNLVPVDSGALRDSIGWTWGKAPKGAGIVAQAKARLGGELTLTIYAGNAKAFYARWQEFGTANQTAQPYFFVSYRAHKKSAKRRISSATRKAAQKVAAQ